MKLLELYKELNNNSDFFNYYFSTSSKNGGKVFSFISTNYRGILNQSGGELQGFARGFSVIENVENIKRSDWSHTTNANQEVEKQHVVNMRKSELFRVVDDAYQKTSRGIVFKKLIDNDVLSYNEKKLICILLLLPGYFSDTPNYILEQTKYFYKKCNNCGYTDAEILEKQKDFVKSCPENVSEIFLKDYVYLDSFYQTFSGINFLKVFHSASDLEKSELKEYISDNHKNRSYRCLLSKKFKPGGNYTKNTIIDNALILYIAKRIIDDETVDFDQFIKNLITYYEEIFHVNTARLKTFIYDTDKNNSVFHVVFCKIKNLPISPLSVEKDLTPEELKQLSSSDATDTSGATALDMVSSSLKKLAKLNSGYKCVLEDCEMCKYFTAKESNQNYLEIHHLIPREFANDFDYPIEIIENYIALCPNCHRKIHLAVDSERKHMINILFNQRKDPLSQHGLDVDRKQLYKYYKIDE